MVNEGTGQVHWLHRKKNSVMENSIHLALTF